ncbi:hypothetical protein QJQ45_015777 [Haematococcus lacustris]|nr:hypothetical protein QJQ45_015777 [Haematococcus lacustris]
MLDGMQPTTPWRAGQVNQQHQQQCTPPSPQQQQQHTPQDQQQQVEQGAQQQPAGPPQGLHLSPTIGHSPSSPRPWLAPSPARPATPSRQPPEEVAAVPTLPLLVPMVPSHPAGPVYSPAWAWERGSSPPAPSLPPAGPTQHGRLGQEQAQGARAASLLTAQAAARAMAEAAAAATAAAVRAAGSSQADQPCLVNLCLWPFDVQQPRQPLGQPLLVVPGTVLCSEMGTHFSPCGRLLAMCVAVEGPSPACTQWMAEHQAKPPPLQGQQQQPPWEQQQQQQQAQPSHQQQQQQDQPQLQQQQGGGPGASHLDPLGCRPGPTRSGQSLTSPSRTIGPHPTAAITATTAASSAASPPDAPLQPPHARLGTPGPTPTNAAAPPPPSLPPGTPPPLNAGHEACLLYELRVYSVASGPSFGQVVAARPLLAAHCLTSLQFSPTSEHLLLAYGRRHLSLCSLVLEAGGLTPVHTVMEVYRVADLALVRLLPSKEDEVNCAAWSPLPGGGLMYGTKEGKLRLLRHDRLLPSEPSLLPGAASSTADEELWDAERRAPGSATEEDDG